jgi:hypothetical protein
MDIQALIEKQRTILETPKSESQPVLYGGEKITVEIIELLPDDWQQLVWENPARAGIKADSNVGFNQDLLPRRYPASRVRVGGEEVDQETWATVYAGLKSAHRNIVTTLIWGVNVYDAMLELAALGKAEADRESASQGNRASRRAGSKGGNPPKSRSTSTPKATSPGTP